MSRATRHRVIENLRGHFGRPARRRRRLRVASAPARSSSWLATRIVAPDGCRLAQCRRVRPDRGVEPGVGFVEQPHAARDGRRDPPEPCVASVPPTTCAPDTRPGAPATPMPCHRADATSACGRTDCASPRTRTFSRSRSGQGIQAVLVAEQSDVRPHAVPLRRPTDRARAPTQSRARPARSPAHSRRSKVVLPAPLGPLSNTISPRCTVSDTPGERREVAEHRDHALEGNDHVGLCIVRRSPTGRIVVCRRRRRRCRIREWGRKFAHETGPHYERRPVTTPLAECETVSQTPPSIAAILTGQGE